VTLLTALVLGFTSAVIPVVSVELGLVAMARASAVPDWLLALAAAVGQVGGKTLWYLVGAGVISRMPGWHRRAGRGRRPRAPSARRALWAVRLAALQAWVGERPWGPGALNFVSALTSVPPFAVYSVLAGTLRMPLPVFLVTGLAGRYLRLLAVLGAGGQLLGWLLG